MQKIQSAAAPSSQPVDGCPSSAILIHPLLTSAGCPASGGGSIVYIKHLMRCIAAGQRLALSPSLQGWMAEVDTLLQSFTAAGYTPLASPTGLDLHAKPWASIHGCIESSRKVATRSTTHLDAIFALAVIDAAGSSARVPDGLLAGLRSCYSALAGQRKIHADWTVIVSDSITSAEHLTQVLPHLTNQPTKAFVTSLVGLLDRPAPDISAIVKLPTGQPERATDVDFTFASATRTNPDTTALPTHDATDSGQSDQSETDPAENASEQRPFTRGDSILQWQLMRARYQRRNDRLLLNSWQSLPPTLTCHVSRRLAQVMQDIHSPDCGAAVLAISCLLTSTPPGVLLHASLVEVSDLQIDLVNQCFCWPLDRLRELQDEAIEVAGTRRLVRIFFPEDLAASMDRLAEARQGVMPLHFSDLFKVSPDTEGWRAMVRQMHDLLKRVGDPGFQAFPTRWSSSVSRVYLEEGGSDLMSAVCCLDLGPATAGAKHYIHPEDEHINALSKKVFARLGLGKPVTVVERLVGLDAAIPSDAELREGFERLDESIRSYMQILSSASTLDERVDAYNKLVEHTAAMMVFCIAGRGSRIGEVTVGAALCSLDMIWLEDKKLELENGSRLIPKSRRVKNCLLLLLTTTQQLAEQICPTLPRNTGDLWHELASGWFRFDALLFQQVAMVSGVPVRSPLESSAIEAVSQRYFRQSKNFMRHVVITIWSTEGRDKNLLRLLTGHASDGLEVPSAGGVYSTKSAIAAAGEVLEDILSRWIPEPDDHPADHFIVKFKGLPGRRIRKVHAAYRDGLREGCAPSFSRWHLAAEAIMTRLRTLLLNGQTPADPIANLWLHLLAFDALHEASDLQGVLIDLNGALERGDGGWTVRFRRTGAPNDHVLALQSPTAVLINSTITEISARSTPQVESTLSIVDAWLLKVMPDCWGGGADKGTTHQCLLACAALWADLVVPPALQYCYAPNSQAAILDPRSAERLYGLARSTQPDALPSTRRVRIQTSGLLEGFLKEINHLGDNQAKLGELKARAGLFKDYVQRLDKCHESHLVCLPIRAVQHNNELIAAGKKNRLELSSLSTYFSHLKPLLISMCMLKPAEFNSLEWAEFNLALAGFVNPNDEQPVGRREAAQWFAKTLCDAGYPVSPSLADIRVTRKFLPSSPASIALATSSDIEAAIELIRSWNSERNLDSTRAALVLELLASLPLRWGEAACLSDADTVVLMDAICIQPKGFSHIKSALSKRFLEIPKALRKGLSEMSERLQNAADEPDSARFLFIEKKDGMFDTGTADWIHQDITTALKFATQNQNFRLHALRARAICELVFPGWMDLVKRPASDPIGPARCAAYFRYNPEAAWRMDRARIIAGHSHVSTTQSFYLACWLPVRVLALAGTLSSERPTSHLLKGLDVTQHALKKHGTRHPQHQSDPWIFVGKCLAARQAPERVRDNSSPLVCAEAGHAEEPSGAPGIQAETQAEIELSPINREATTLYVALRLLGLGQVEVADTTRVNERLAVGTLEPLIARSAHSAAELRGRIKGDLTGRAIKADKRQILSPDASKFLSVLREIPNALTRDLLQILLPNHSQQLWPSTLQKLAPRFAKSSWRLEFVCDIRLNNPELSHKLSQTQGLAVGNPCHDIGRVPRIFMVPADPKARNTVVKARLTVMARVLCSAYLLLLDTPR